MPVLSTAVSPLDTVQGTRSVPTHSLKECRSLSICRCLCLECSPSRSAYGRGLLIIHISA